MFYLMKDTIAHKHVQQVYIFIDVLMQCMYNVYMSKTVTLYMLRNENSILLNTLRRIVQCKNL